MVGGRYVWGGSQFGATDCSGLTMLSYQQIGVSLPHLASSQANYGTNVSRSDIQPGDLVFFGGSSYSSIYHVAMYIGDGKIVHAESAATGIVISYLDSVALYNNITCIKRLI
jgi:cell wall-associated NlpC family hydrolase